MGWNRGAERESADSAKLPVLRVRCVVLESIQRPIADIIWPMHVQELTVGEDAKNITCDSSWEWETDPVEFLFNQTIEGASGHLAYSS